jgi:hypothetical protein
LTDTASARAVTEAQNKQIKELLAAGWATKEIADRVGVSRGVVAGIKAAHTIDYKHRIEIVKATERWAVTMAQVAIRRSAARAPWPRWQFASFDGPAGRESGGVVDLIAVRKDHRLKGEPVSGLKPGDPLEIVLIQVKGGSAAKPTAADAERLRLVQSLHKARHVVLASWKRGNEAKCYLLRPKRNGKVAGWKGDWDASVDFRAVFG